MNLDLLAQKPMNKPDRIAFLSENMNLSSDEAEKFWPLLNDMESELKALKKELKENKPEVVKQFIKAKLPRGKIAEAEELIPLFLLLAGEGSSMFGGSCVPVDAGEGKSFMQN